MGDSCTSVSLSLVGSIMYWPRRRVESWVRILPSKDSELLYSNCHYQLEVGRNGPCSYRASIFMHETIFVHMSGIGVSFYD